MVIDWSLIEGVKLYSYSQMSFLSYTLNLVDLLEVGFSLINPDQYLAQFKNSLGFELET